MFHRYVDPAYAVRVADLGDRRSVQRRSDLRPAGVGCGRHVLRVVGKSRQSADLPCVYSGARATGRQRDRAQDPRGSDGSVGILGHFLHAGDVGGGNGDLYVEINIKRHKDFERDGANLYYEKQISFVQASLGDTVDIPTIDGEVELKIPPGTQSGTVFRLKEKGMPQMRRTTKGNLYVTITVVVPQKLNKEQQKLLRKFAQISGDEISVYKKGIFDKVRDAINNP